MHELSESTKRIIDAGSAAFVAASATAGALTLADWALIATICTAALNGAWQVLRFYDRVKYGHRGKSD